MADTSNKTEPPKTSRVKRAAKFMFDVPSWIGTSLWTGVFGWIKELIVGIVSGAFNASKPHQSETFDAATQRLQVTEEDLQKQQKLYLKSSWLFLIVGVLAIFYIAYIWHSSVFFAKIGGILVVLICMLQAMRFSFWSFQIKQRRLGCTLKQWFNWLMRGHA